MTSGPRRRQLCSFCTRALAEVDWMFLTGVHGVGATICDYCVDGLHAALHAPESAPSEFVAAAPGLARMGPRASAEQPFPDWKMP